MSKDSHFHLKPALIAPTSFHFWYLLSNSVQSIFKFWILYSFHTSELFRVYLSISSSWWFSNYLFNFFFFLLNFTVQSWNHWDWLYVKFTTNFSKRIKWTSSRIRYPGFTVSLCCFQALSNYLTFHHLVLS